MPRPVRSLVTNQPSVYYYWSSHVRPGVITIYSISESIKVLGFTNIGSIVYNLYKQLPGSPNRYIVYIDNFFTSVDFYSALRDIGIGTVGIIKAGSYSIELLTLNSPFSKQKSGDLP